MNFQSVEEAVKFIATSTYIDYDASFSLSKYCSMLLRTSGHERHGRDLVIRIHDAWERLEENTKVIWNDLTEAAGLYPYVDATQLSRSALLRYEFHKSPFLNDIYLHEEQLLLSIELQNEKAVVVSAPTSFGKSLLIEEVIASKKFSEIVVIQPTLALLDETRKKLAKYRNDYKIVVSTSQEPDASKKNIYLFTAERVVEYEHFAKIDFFVIDEFYKLSVARDDDRAIALNQAFVRLLRMTNKFYLLGPVIKDIPLAFQKKFELFWYNTEFATVAVDEVSYEIVGKYAAAEKKRLKKERLFEFLATHNEPTLIYCSSPNKATLLSLEFAHFLKNADYQRTSPLSQEIVEMCEWISENINREWALIPALESKIAFHHGAIPRHLGSSIVDEFNAGSVQWLFCTSTLIEGVNTSAKNVVFFDKEKGGKKIDFFDYKNIAGRSGRMKQHFIGNVIRFEKQPDQMELFVDIPMFEQNDAPIEVLITLNDAELDEAGNHKLVEFNQLDESFKQALRKNASISFEGQMKIVKEIESNISYYHPLLSWSSFPKYDQLLAVIELCWRNLLKPGDNKADVRSPAQLATLTLKYTRFQSTAALIAESINDDFYINLYPVRSVRIDALAFFILNVTRHWFDYKLPKWLSVISSLQEYVFDKHGLAPGNYSYYATLLEHSFLPPGIAALSEYDIPTSAISKLQKGLNPEFSTEQLIAIFNRQDDESLKQRGLIAYEIRKIRRAN